ncbi:MAG: hypothetical protein JWO33_1244 [Caulobacteraceae bacterium]|nr:hypothetical protein [Caulobacteraceae bacterium]
MRLTWTAAAALLRPMLSVIVDARAAPENLPVLLAALTMGAVDGVVRDVVIAAQETSPLIEALCEETGAEVALGGLGAAAAQARHERVLVLPAALRPKMNWIATLNDHLARGGQDALLIGEGAGGLLGVLSSAPYGVLTERSRLDGLVETELKGLRRRLRGPVPRLR